MPALGPRTRRTWITLALAVAPLAAQPPGGVVEEELGAEPARAEAPLGLEAAAEQAYADGDLPRAGALYRQLAEAESEPRQRARHLVTAAWLAFQLGDPEGARADLERALFEDPETPFRSELYSPEFAALRQDALSGAVVRRQREAVDLLNRAVTAISAQRYPEARELLVRGLRFAPDDPDAVYNLAVVDLRSGDREAALAGFERVLALERGNPSGVSRELKSQALNNAAVIYFGRGQFADAETALAEAVELDPGDAKSWFNLGLTRAKLDRDDAAFAAFRRARELDPSDVDVAYQLALAQIERAAWPEAVALLLETTRDQPGRAELWTSLGRAQRGLGNVDGALASFDRAIGLDADNRAGHAEPAALLAAEVRLARGDAVGAAAAAELAAGWRPQRADAWMLLGLARLAAGDAGAARESLERASALAPERADIAHNLGSAYLAERDLARAEAAFRRELELDPDAAEARDLLARIEAQRAAPAPAPRRPAAPRAIGARLSRVDYKALGIQGLLVEDLVAGGAAARAGLREGDLILRGDGRAFDSAEGLAGYATGRTVRLDVLREGKPVELRLSLD